jgi:hypothetical protein
MSRISFAGVLLACTLIAGFEALTAVTDVAQAQQRWQKPGERVVSNTIAIKNRVRGPWPNLPIAPSYLAYDYPYYYNRGHYPTHIGGPGFVYSGLPYGYRAGGCSYWPAKSLRRAWTDARKCIGQ